MSRENVEVVRRIYDASTRRDAEAVLSLYDPEVEWDTSQHPYGDMFGSRTYRGHEELRSWFREWYEAFEGFTHSCEELIDAGEQVVSVGIDRGRGRGSGVEVERPIAGLWTLRDRRVVRVVWFPSRDQALKAAGPRA